MGLEDSKRRVNIGERKKPKEKRGRRKGGKEERRKGGKEERRKGGKEERIWSDRLALCGELRPDC